MWMQGIMMDLPEGKLPGFYAQIVKTIAHAATIFDRDKELIVVRTQEEQQRIIEELDRYHVPYESLRLLLLPDDAHRDARAQDYGFISRSGNAYLYGDTIALYGIHPIQPDGAEIIPAQMQMDEFLIASFMNEGQTWYCVESHLRETISGIALRYGVVLDWFE
jgi:hypothetical protein